jgi:hypothetical protein
LPRYRTFNAVWCLLHYYCSHICML